MQGTRAGLPNPDNFQVTVLYSEYSVFLSAEGPASPGLTGQNA
jgi:hypothetical protein